MTLLDRYLKGDTRKVYEDIYSLEQDALKPDYFSDIDLILTETFKRVAFNLAIIYKELKSSNYKFVFHIKYDWAKGAFAARSKYRTINV
jgi:hypothetical protein